MLTIKDRLLRFLLLLLYVNPAQSSVWQVQLHRTKIDGSLGAVTVRGLHTQFGVKRRRQCESQCSSRIELFPSSNHPLRFVKSVNELIGFVARSRLSLLRSSEFDDPTIISGNNEPKTDEAHTTEKPSNKGNLFTVH